LPQSDFVTLHCPLTPETKHVVSETFLRRMKPTALLINTGRGALVDEEALARALSRGTIAGACLDVLEHEPPAPSHPLLDPNAPWADRLVSTPHLAWATVEARKRLIASVADNLGAFVRGEVTNRVEIRRDRLRL
jgi:glycerate dehydrogenase